MRMASTSWVKHAVRRAVSWLFYVLGALWLWQVIALRRKAVVLMYHRVLTTAERGVCGSHPGIVVDRATFARHLEVLRRRFVILSLEEFADHLERKIPFPSSSCLVTFDDGWLDNRINALPLLEQARCPALVFLPVNCIGRRRPFWRESLSQLLVRTVLEVRNTPSSGPRLRELLEPFGLAQLLALPDADPRAAVVELVSRLSPTPAAAARLVESLLTAMGIAVEEIAADDAFLSWEDVDAMARAGTTFGGHGAEHLRLTDLSLEAARDDIAVSKSVIADKFPETLPAFSYPNGCVTPEISELVRLSGYRLAFTTQAGYVRCDDDPFMLKRRNIHEAMTDSTPMFLARVLGFW